MNEARITHFRIYVLDILPKDLRICRKLRLRIREYGRVEIFIFLKLSSWSFGGTLSQYIILQILYFLQYLYMRLIHRNTILFHLHLMLLNQKLTYFLHNLIYIWWQGEMSVCSFLVLYLILLHCLLEGRMYNKLTHEGVINKIFHGKSAKIDCNYL